MKKKIRDFLEKYWDMNLFKNIIEQIYHTSWILDYFFTDFMLFNTRICISPKFRLLSAVLWGQNFSAAGCCPLLHNPRQSGTQPLQKLSRFLFERPCFPCLFSWTFIRHCFLWCCSRIFERFRKMFLLCLGKRGYQLWLAHIGSRFARVMKFFFIPSLPVQ